MAPILKFVLFGGRGAASPIGDLGLAILRVGTGLYLALGHGMGKLFSDGHLGPSAKFIEMTGKMGFPAPTFFAWCSALAESLVALIFAAGLCTRPAAAILAFNMAVAAFISQLHAPWIAIGGASKEPSVLYLLPFITFLFTGAGHFSADSMIRTMNSREN